MKSTACKERTKYINENQAASAAMAYVRSEFQISYCETCHSYHLDFHRPEAERIRVDYSSIKF